MKKNFEGIRANPWGLTTRIDLSEKSGFMEGRKYRMNIGECKKLLTDKLEVFSLGGNKQVQRKNKRGGVSKVVPMVDRMEHKDADLPCILTSFRPSLCNIRLPATWLS